MMSYEDGNLRIVVHTGNLIESDWEDRTQGAYHYNPYWQTIVFLNNKFVQAFGLVRLVHLCHQKTTRRSEMVIL